MSSEASSESSVCRAGDRYCVGMCEWTDCRHLPTLTTDLKPHLSLPQTSCESLLPRPAKPSASKQSLLPRERFQFFSEENLLELAKGFTPANTRSSTKWALNVFELWKQARNTQHPGDPVPQDLSPVTHHCSILTSQSLLSKLGKLMERFIHQAQYISYSVDYYGT